MKFVSALKSFNFKPNVGALKSLKISTRIAISTVLSSLMIAAVGMLFMLSEQQKSSAIDAERHYANVQQLAQTVGRSNLFMRQFEKDFILRDDLTLADRQKEESAQSAAVLDELSAVAGESEIAQNITATQALLAEYRSLFDVLVETSIEISPNADSGFFFDFTEADKVVAKKIKPYKSDIVNLEYTRMRLAERNFILYGGDRNILAVDKQIKKILRAAQKDNVDPMERIELADLIEVYNVGFDEYAGAKARHQDLQGQLDGLYTQMAEQLSIVIAHADQMGIAARQDLAAATENARMFIYSVIGAALLLTILAGVAIGWTIVQPLKKITGTMRTLSEGDLDAEVPFTSRTNELGEMARAVEVFRANGLKVNEMTEEEKMASKQRAEDRSLMMKELQRAFGEVVDAAVAGDFTKRVTSEFPDDELNQLAHGVNDLVETVDRGVSETGQVLSALANTDLTKRMSGEYQGAFLQLKNDTNRVGDKLTEVVSGLRTTSRALKNATGEILSGANDLSERTTRQAASIEETSAATEQLDETVRDNTMRAEQAQHSALEASAVAERGGEVMSQANDAMQRITASSNKISDIIGMIDDIAFQTNLLALNASVEAARAGEAGKGFAVVAVEVRRLAQSAAEASNEVKSLIEQSVTEVNSGSKLVAQAAENLDGIVESVKGVTSLMDEIASESKKQATSIGEISTSIREMDEMTQHNAALVEQTNAAIDQTETQATELDHIVEQFRIDQDERQGQPAASPSRPAAQTSPPEQQEKATSAYLSHGNAAVKQSDEEWQEF